MVQQHAQTKSLIKQSRKKSDNLKKYGGEE